jgi:hypothetical protein
MIWVVTESRLRGVGERVRDWGNQETAHSLGSTEDDYNNHYCNNGRQYSLAVP